MPIVHTAGRNYLNDYASQLRSFVFNFLLRVTLLRIE